MVDWQRMVLEEFRLVVAAFIVLFGLLTGYLLGRVNERLLRGVGLDQAVEGTSVERTARNLGTSTVTALARLSSWIVYGVAVLLAMQVADVVPIPLLGAYLAAWVPRVLLAAVAILLGFVVGDKVELVVSERLRGVKVPEISVVPRAVKWSIVFIAVLVGLGELGISTGALLLLLGAYAAAVILFGVVALRFLLASGAAGVYLLLHEPYSIGDRVAIGEREGVVQEVDVFVTHVEEDGVEYVVPNHLVLREGVALMRE